MIYRDLMMEVGDYRSWNHQVMPIVKADVHATIFCFPLFN